MADVLVICEWKDGSLKKASREALTIGKKLADQAGGTLVAFAGGKGAGALAEETGKFGATKLLIADDAQLDTYSTEPAAASVKMAVDNVNPGVVLLSTTSSGKDLAPRLAARCGAGVASDVVGLEWTNGKLVARRPVYSGKAFATVEVSSTPAIASCRANAFPAQETGGGASEVVDLGYSAVESKAKVVETKAPETTEVMLAEADIVVAGGRGLKEAENFKLIRDLANALGAAVGASRAIVDAGWIDHQYQVGQTGRVVSPNLYIAAGISGAIQHLAGMNSSKHIVAINKDADAPIFRIADLGVVGDLFELLPALTEEIRKAKG
jgi:electron transfer flavoprotein alpha subunit